MWSRSTQHIFTLIPLLSSVLFAACAPDDYRQSTREQQPGTVPLNGTRFASDTSTASPVTGWLGGTVSVDNDSIRVLLDTGMLGILDAGAMASLEPISDLSIAVALVAERGNNRFRSVVKSPAAPLDPHLAASGALDGIQRPFEGRVGFSLPAAYMDSVEVPGLRIEVIMFPVPTTNQAGRRYLRVPQEALLAAIRSRDDEAR